MTQRLISADSVSLTFTGPIPGPPFRSCLNPTSSLFVDIQSLGYVEEEWFVSGVADSVDAANELLAASQPFNTRLLRRRSIEGSSGVVYLEPLHPNDEDTPAWTNAWRHLVRSGHTWVGVTTTTGAFSLDGRQGSGGIVRLQRENVQRYAGLHLYDPGIVGERVTLGPNGIDPSIVAGMSLIDTQGASILAQLADALRVGARRVYAVGFSHTGRVWSRFLDGGNHAFDGYLTAVVAGPSALPADAVVIESELVGTLRPPIVAGDDSDSPRFRGYEVPGTFHYWTLKSTRQVDHGARHNDKPWQLLLHAILANMERWVDDGVPMPRASRVERTGEGLARDADGNALGGIRSPWVDIPDGRYSGRCSCSPVMGGFEPFSAEEMQRRYGDRYHELLRGRAEELVAGGWLLAEDLDQTSGKGRQ